MSDMVQTRIQQLAVDLDLENDSDPDEALRKLAQVESALDVLTDWYESRP